MEDINIQVLQGFNLKVKSISKSKLTYICKTDNGIRAIRPTSTDLNQLIFIHNIKEHLFKNGFTNIDRFYISLQNKPFFTFNGNTYVMTDYIDCPETDFSNIVQFKEIVKTVSLFHKKCIGMSSDFDYKVNYANYCDIADVFRKKIDHMKTMKKFVNSRSHLSDFDVLFIKNYMYFYNEAQEALQLLEASNYKVLQATAVQNNMICHNILKEENILSCNDKFYIVNFNNCSINHFIFDLSELINRYIRKHDVEFININEFLNIYNSVNTITTEEISVLYALLKFPSKFIKICQNYYNKNRSWVPNSIINKFKDTIELKDHHKSYIDELVVSTI